MGGKGFFALLSCSNQIGLASSGISDQLHFQEAGRGGRQKSSMHVEVSCLGVCSALIPNLKVQQPLQSYVRDAIWHRCSMHESKVSVRRRFMAPMATAGLETFTETLAHNQALWSSTSAMIAAQLLKPVTAAIAGKGFDIRLVIKSGGMPSSHSASVTALATAVGLLRGFDDPIFAACVVGASVVMYDAQGVRRAAGKQAEVINTLVVPRLIMSENSRTGLPNKDELAEPVGAKATSNEKVREGDGMTLMAVNVSPDLRPRNFFEAARGEPSMRSNEVIMQELEAEEGWRHIPLKESVGHTKLEVAVGAIAGVLVAILLDQFLYNPSL